MRVFRRPFKSILILLAAVFLLIFLHYFKITTPLEGLIQKILNPIEHQFYVVGTTINKFYRHSGAPEDILTINQELTEKIKILTVENAQLKTLLLEKEREDQQIEFLTAEGLAAITAKIIGRSFQANQQTLIINKGWSDGVMAGAPVIAQQGVLIGQIAFVNSHSAHIILINDSLSSFGAVIQNQTFAKGVVVGDRGLSLKMELIPQGEEITVGDIVVTSGIEANIPRGLIIGQIEQVITKPNDLFQEAFIKTLVDFDDLVVVSVLKQQANDQNN